MFSAQPPLRASKGGGSILQTPGHLRPTAALPQAAVCSTGRSEGLTSGQGCSRPSGCQVRCPGEGRAAASDGPVQLDPRHFLLLTDPIIFTLTNRISPSATPVIRCCAVDRKVQKKSARKSAGNKLGREAASPEGTKLRLSQRNGASRWRRRWWELVWSSCSSQRSLSSR